MQLPNEKEQFCASLYSLHKRNPKQLMYHIWHMNFFYFFFRLIHHLCDFFPNENPKQIAQYILSNSLQKKARYSKYDTN